MLIQITIPFRFAHRGIDVVDYPKGTQDVPAEVADVALAEGWAVAADTPVEPAPEPAKPKPRRK